MKIPASLVLSAIFAMMADPSAQAETQPSPAAYWTMDEITDGMLPDQGGTHDAKVPQLIGQRDVKTNEILPDFTPGTEDGIDGKALALTREQQGFLEVPAVKTFHFESGLTVSLWVKIEVGNAMMNLLSCAEDVTDPAGGWTLSYSYGDVIFKAVDADGKTVTVNLPTNDVAAGAWVHIAAVADATTLRLYINGVEEASKAFSGPVKMADAPLVIGNHATIAGWRHSECPAFGGLMDEVKIFEAPLSAENIKTESEHALSGN